MTWFGDSRCQSLSQTFVLSLYCRLLILCTDTTGRSSQRRMQDQREQEKSTENRPIPGERSRPGEGPNLVFSAVNTYTVHSPTDSLFIVRVVRPSMYDERLFGSTIHSRSLSVNVADANSEAAITIDNLENNYCSSFFGPQHLVVS
jgi:hypothetical protein